jgi:hypothetical protein
MEKEMRKAVFNLEFPSWTKEMSIHGYRFYRVTNYEERLKALQHLSNHHSEFSVSTNEGRHSHTAYVEPPSSELQRNPIELMVVVATHKRGCGKQFGHQFHRVLQ